MYTFGKDIETRHGNYRKGEPLPVEWDTRETRKQLVEKFGADVLVQGGSKSDEQRLSAIEKSLERIEAALGLKQPDASKTQGQSKGRA